MGRQDAVMQQSLYSSIAALRVRIHGLNKARLVGPRGLESCEMLNQRNRLMHRTEVPQSHAAERIWWAAVRR